MYLDIVYIRYTNCSFKSLPSDGCDGTTGYSCHLGSNNYILAAKKSYTMCT